MGNKLYNKKNFHELYLIMKNLEKNYPHPGDCDLQFYANKILTEII